MTRQAGRHRHRAGGEGRERGSHGSGEPADAGELRFAVRLTPRAGLDRVDGVEGGVLRCRVAAAPVDGGANEALARLVARELDAPRSSVRLVAGDRSRDKVVAVPANRRDRVIARWPGLLGRSEPDV